MRSSNDTTNWFALALAALALAALALAGCAKDPTTTVAPNPVVRTTTVIVVDSLGAPARGANLFATRVDVLGASLFGATDSAGVGSFTLAEGRWAVSASSASLAAPRQVAGSTGRIPGAVAGAPDTVVFRLRLASESIARGRTTLVGQTDHSGTFISTLELPVLTSTDSTGAWTLTGLPPGVWTGTAVQFGYQLAVFDLVVPAPGASITVAPNALPHGPSPAARPR
jgi:hypothetical protein